jgi:hypothetical protein
MKLSNQLLIILHCGSQIGLEEKWFKIILVIFYYLNGCEIWPNKRGGLWWEFPYKRGTILYYQFYNNNICYLMTHIWASLFHPLNNISVKSWPLISLVEETGVPRENHWPVASHWQALSHNVVSGEKHSNPNPLSSLDRCYKTGHAYKTFNCNDFKITIFLLEDNHKF